MFISHNRCRRPRAGGGRRKQSVKSYNLYKYNNIYKCTAPSSQATKGGRRAAPRWSFGLKPLYKLYNYIIYIYYNYVYIRRPRAGGGRRRAGPSG